MQRIEFKVGLFITTVSLLILVTIGYVAYRKGVFSKFHTYTLSSQTGENLTEGMPVAVQGFTIGRVSSLELSDQGVVLIRIKIPERHVRMIRADSSFLIDKPLIGTPRIVVRTSSMNSPPLSPQAVPELTESSDINEIIKRAQPIVDKADRIMGNIEAITANLADPAGDVNRILQNTEALVSRYSKSASLLEMAIGDPESVRSIHAALRRLREISATADGLLRRVDEMAGKTDQQVYGSEGLLPQFRNILRDLLSKLKKMDTTLDNMNKISTEAADSTKDLKALRNELDLAVGAIRELAAEIDRMIPFKEGREIGLP